MASEAVDPRRRHELRRRAWLLAGASGLVVMAHPVDVLVAGGADWGALGLRLLWAALLLATAGVLAVGSWAATRALGALAGLGTAVIFLALVVRTGGTASPLYVFIAVLAIVIPVLTGELIRVGLASSGLLVAGAIYLQGRGGVPAPQRVASGITLVVAFALGWLLALSDLRARLQARRLAEAREEALRQLAASERLAAVGRLAAEVAHGVNNPLAVARSSASFLRDGGHEGGEAEAAWEDLAGSLDRIAAEVRRLSRDTAPPEGPPHP